METTIKRVLTGLEMNNLFNTDHSDFLIKSYKAISVSKSDYPKPSKYKYKITIRHSEDSFGGMLFDAARKKLALEAKANVSKSKQITRDEFMKFFRDDDCLNTLSPDDRIEVFMSVLLGSSDITKDRLNELISDYSVGNLVVKEV